MRVGIADSGAAPDVCLLLGFVQGNSSSKPPEVVVVRVPGDDQWSPTFDVCGLCWPARRRCTGWLLLACLHVWSACCTCASALSHACGVCFLTTSCVVQVKPTVTEEAKKL